jgi:hypothetical protein
MENSLFSSNFEPKSKNFEILIFPPRYAGIVIKIRKPSQATFLLKGITFKVAISFDTLTHLVLGQCVCVKFYYFFSI